VLLQASELVANRSLIPRTTRTYVSSPFDEQFFTFTIGDLVVLFVVEANRELFPSEDVLLAETAQGGDCRVSIKTDQHAPPFFRRFRDYTPTNSGR
jgi:hypothetical protein